MSSVSYARDELKMYSSPFADDIVIDGDHSTTTVVVT
jgi:hypothetical protein